MNRRAFLKSLGTAVAAAPVAAPLLARDAAAASGEQLATLFDLTKCVGCGACVAACREAHAADYPNPQKPFPKMYPSRVKAEDFSDKREVDDRLTPCPSFDETGNKGARRAAKGAGQELRSN